MKKQILTFFVIVLSFCATYAQTADVLAGCIPLEVNFTSPALSNYYWDFGDLASSDLQNPEHIFTSAGTFTVGLFEGENGTKIGNIEIKVYPDPVIEITGTPVKGCSPLEVAFDPSIVIDSDVSILSYQWTFGDGNSSDLEQPSHTFNNAGTYTVSLAIETSLVECNKTIIVNDLIVVEGVASFFNINKSIECDIPATFILTNQSENSPELDYFWDFGNGTDFMGFDPSSVSYNKAGTYTISLTVVNEQGCESTYSRIVQVGLPPFDLTFTPQICLGTSLTIINNTPASSYLWEFDAPADMSTSEDKSPIVTFLSGGMKNIKLTIGNQLNCQKDTTIVVEVQDPSAEFTINPALANCIVPVDLNLSAVNKTYANYTWNVDPANSPDIQVDFEWPKRDSLHLHWIDSFLVELTVTTDIGCQVGRLEWFSQRKPDAYFTTNHAKGCAPLKVSFTDDSRSTEEIISWKWLYGNGDENTFSTNDIHDYTFEEPGEYYVRLVIENNLGCIDTSAGLWILVGEEIQSDYEIDKTEICLGEVINISLTNLDPKIDAWHVATDENRFSHCWDSNSSSHIFSHAPGSYDITLTTEYNGCYWNETITDAITVQGSKSNISWMTNCEDPYSVMFDSKSLGETGLSWNLTEPDQYLVDSFTHSFDTTGNYTIYLTTVDNTSDCPISVDSAVIYIRDLKADFTLDEKVCDNQNYVLNAENSVDVNTSCSKGFLWYLPTSRPRELSSDFVETSFPAGDQSVTLVVEDINGCTDTLTKSTKSYGINPQFTKDKSSICLPAIVNFEDQSTADTTIVSWEWSFGSEDSITSFEFPIGTPGNQIAVGITLTDAIGCTDVVSQSIGIYQVTSSISIDNGPGICVGESIGFSATDFTSQGSFLNYEWDFGPFGTGDQQTEVVLFDQNGQYDISLQFVEDSSGCAGTAQVPITVVDVPVADFATDVDDLVEICHPAIIEFNNNSTWEGFVTHRWDFGDGVKSSEINPFNSFEKGMYEVELIVSSVFGCKDTITKTYNLVGPEGDFTLDKNEICLGDSIFFTLIDPIDVNSYTWVFGDGTIAEDVSPISHVYDFNPMGGETKVDLILKSVENGCEFIITEPISITDLGAEFSFVDSSYCEGLAFFKNLSTGDVSNLSWEFGNGESSTAANPSIIYDELGEYTVTLRVSDAANLCKDEISKDISIEEVEDFIFFPNVFTPNSDGLNDYFNIAVTPGYEDVVKVVNFKVYNRWGNLIYDNETPDLGWDGNISSTLAPTEIYAYYIDVEIIDCNNQSKKGNVTIVR